MKQPKKLCHGCEQLRVVTLVKMGEVTEPLCRKCRS